MCIRDRLDTVRDIRHEAPGIGAYKLYLMLKELYPDGMRCLLYTSDSSALSIRPCMICCGISPPKQAEQMIRSSWYFSNNSSKNSKAATSMSSYLTYAIMGVGLSIAPNYWLRY